MKVYFVRHGRSTLNIESRYQFPDTPLSELGQDQARKIAKRFKSIPIDLIITSPYIRTLHTAEAIKEVTKVKVIEETLFRERQMPTSFLGKHIEDPKLIPFHQQIREHFGEPDWHLEDEENFSDLLKRAKESIQFLLSRKEENIAVVTHGYFLTVIVFYILFGEEATPKLFRDFYLHTSHKNTGLTVAEYKDNNWVVITWNDHAHLGE